MATDTDKDSHIDKLKEHPSIQKIKQILPTNNPKFSFKPVSGSEINKILSSIDSKKSTGADYILAKIVKLCISPISGVLVNLINTTFQHGKFPASPKGFKSSLFTKRMAPWIKKINLPTGECTTNILKGLWEGNA